MKQIIIISMLFLLSACGTHDQKRLSDDVVLASSQELSVTLAELREHITDLPVHLRWNSELDPQQWYADQINLIMIQKLLLTEAKLIGYEQDPKYLNKVRNLERMVYSSQYLNEFQPPQKPSEAELKNHYEEHLDEFVFPESRRVFHIFQSHKEGVETTKQRMQSLRNRLIKGENIQLLAPEYSESESRHKKGLIGLIKQGDLSADFDRVVFKLNINQPSELIRTADGYHIFVVSEVLPAQSYSFESVQGMILQRLQVQHTLAFIQEKAELLEPPEPFMVPDMDQLQQLMRQGNPQAPLIQVGNYSKPMAQFMFEMREMQAKMGAVRDPQMGLKMLTETAYREWIYQHMQAEQATPAHPDRLAKAKEDLLIDEYRPVKLRAYVNQNPQLLNDYFAGNEMRFSTPVMVQLKRLQIPIEEGINLMPDLEQLISRLDLGEVKLEEVAEQYQGQVQPLPLMNAQNLKRIDPRMLRFAFLLNPQEHTPPYRTENHYIILKLIERKEAKVQPLATIRDQVMNQFIRSHSADLFSQLKEQLLSEVKIHRTLLSDVHLSLQQ
ncbi:peptidylprolyl isomerase [Marinicella sediminis]|uniref:peptidylprolyl isomerase n=1 Tax=Marinicella sediminis TaxID=1792834 RepID=A0ABV7JC26_9GAMM|nr:peptidyl-prolyl cis-trans isomerase [Marinicella sediminis]